MLVYAILVTFVFGMLMGSCATIIAALRMEKCCPFCTGPINILVKEKEEKDEQSNILNYDNV